MAISNPGYYMHRPTLSFWLSFKSIECMEKYDPSQALVFSESLCQSQFRLGKKVETFRLGIFGGHYCIYFV